MEKLQVIDSRNMPAYRIAEASQYLRIPIGSVRSWIYGKEYPAGGGIKQSPPVIKIPHKNKPFLSFYNLCEIHVLDALRREHKVSLQKVRKALMLLQEKYRSKRPLIEETFHTDKLNIFVEKYGEIINMAKDEQVVLKEVMMAHLHRVHYDENGLIKKLFPFTRGRSLDEPQIVMIDPLVSFGRPALSGTGIGTATIAQRYKAGDSISLLAKDYGIEKSKIEEAIRCELYLKAA